MGVGGGAAASSTPSTSATSISEGNTTPSAPSTTSTIVKTVVGGGSLLTLLAGLRSAYKHTRQPEAKDLARIQVLSGVGFAAKALTLATVITVSGFSLLVISVSAIVGVSTPKEFGRAMRAAFGNSLRLPASEKSQSWEDIVRAIEARDDDKRKETISVSSILVEMAASACPSSSEDAPLLHPPPSPSTSSSTSTIPDPSKAPPSTPPPLATAAPSLPDNSNDSPPRPRPRLQPIGIRTQLLPLAVHVGIGVVLVWLVPPIFLPLLALLSIVSLTWSALLLRHPLPEPLRSARSVLLFIAHPDDETMFFAPILLALARSNVRVYLLCASTGNFYGEGSRRCAELPVASWRLGVDPSDVTILDVDGLKDGTEWAPSDLVPLLVRHARSLSVDAVISFDDVGVSGHQNHTACSLAMKAAREEIPDSVQMLRLVSPSLARKYSSVLGALLISAIRDPPTMTTVARPSHVARTWHAMRAHASQLLWFRYLYMLSSSLVLTNTFSRMERRRRGEVYDDAAHVRRQRSSGSLSS